MALIKELKGSFVGGKVSKPLQNRTDLEKFNTWLTEAKNTQIKPEGSISNRAGTIYVGECKVPSYRLTINVNVSATIIINGVTYSGASVYVDLPTGSASYEYEVSAEGYDTKSGSGTITEDTVITVTLEADANDYTFEITPTPVDATVTINGTEQSSITAPAGTLIEWEVSKTGYVTQSGSFLLSSDTESPMVVTLEPVKYKIYYFYYDTNTQNIKLDLFKEVDEYNFKDVVPDYTSKTFVADGCVYQVQNGSFVKLVDGGCSSCSFTFYVKNGVIYNTTSQSYNNDHTWSRVGYCKDINKLYALTTDGDLYVINTQTSGEDHDLTETISYINDNIVDLKCSSSICIYYQRYYDTAFRHNVFVHNGTTGSQWLHAGSNKEDIGVQLVNAGSNSGFPDATICVYGIYIYIATSSPYDKASRASGWYNNTYGTGQIYYIKEGKLMFRQKQNSPQVIDNGTLWTDVSINLSKSVSRNVGNASLAIYNNNLYFIDQYTQGGDTYLLEAPTLLNGAERFIEVYTLCHGQSTETNPVMFAIAREI